MRSSTIFAIAFALFAAAAVLSVPIDSAEQKLDGGQILVYNLSDKTILARTVIGAPIYGTL